MSVLFDHDTSQKTRRAVIVTSVIIIVLHYVQLRSDELEIFKLKIIVQKENIVLFLKVGLGYLVYMFFVYEISTYWTERTKRLLDRQREELLAADTDEDEYKINLMKPSVRQVDTRLKVIEEKFKKEETSRLLRLETNLRFLRDYLPVFLFVFLALSELHENVFGRYILIEIPHIDKVESSLQGHVYSEIEEAPNSQGD